MKNNQTEQSANITLTLSDDDETRQFWNYKFDLIYEIILKHNSLECILTVINKGKFNLMFNKIKLLFQFLSNR